MRRLGLAVALWAAAASAAPDEGAELLSLFTSRAPLLLEAAGLPWVSLGLTPEVLERCQGDLSDVRVIDGRGRMVPYRVHTSAKELYARQPAKVLRAEREQGASRDVVPARWTEAYTLEVPELPAGARSWTLTIASSVGEFVREVQVTDADARTPLAQGTVFRLPRMGAEQLQLPLPLPGVSRTSRLRVAFDGQGGGFLSPTFALEASAREPQAPMLRVSGSGAGSGFERAGELSVATFPRPSGLVPDRLVFRTSTPVFVRAVRVFDVAATGEERLIGEGRIFRHAGSVQAERLEVKVSEARGEQLRVQVVDADSGPLLDLTTELALEQPTLLFALSPEQAREPVWLYFGGGRTKAPRFDLAELEAWETPPALTVPASRLGPMEGNPSFRDTPPLETFMKPGAEVDARLFTHRRVVRIAAGGAGLSELSLTPDDVALLRPDFGDVRLVDSEGRQWPFLLEERPGEVMVTAAPPQRDGEVSRYELPLPARPLWISQVEVRPSAHFYSRPAKLFGVDETGKEELLAATQLVSNPTPRGQPSHLTLALHSPRRLERLVLVVDDGQEAPLPQPTLTVRTVGVALLAVAPQGTHDLLLGHPETARPRYDIERARELMLAVRPATPVVLDLERNPRYRAGLTLARSATPSRILLWATLAAAVLVLGLLTLRMARREAE